MMVQAHEEMGEGLEIPTDPHHTPIIQPSTSQPQKKQSRRKQRKDAEIPQSVGHTFLTLETTKTAQAKEIASLKKRVKKLERKRKSKTPGMKRLFKIEVTLIDETQGRNDDNLIATTTMFNELTLAHTLIEIKAAKPKLRGYVQEQANLQQTTTTTTPGCNLKTFTGQSEKKVDDSTKRAGTELEQEVAKKQKVDDDKEREDLQQCFELVIEEDVAIDAIPLATKHAPIVNFQIHRKGRNGYYEIMRADGNAKTYLLFSQLLKEFEREDLENLWKLKMKSMEELTRKESIALEIYHSYEVHFVRFEDMHVYMLVEKRYPLTPATITDMLNKKLKSDYWN
ncbi:hypothetical protein Tco_0676531 [Tanacetum coccineum]